MRVIIIIAAVIFVCVVSLAQNDDCDPPASMSFSHGNSWLESKKSVFSINCMLQAINKVHSDAYGVAVVKGVSIQNIISFESVECASPVGCWKSTASGMYKPIKFEATDELLVYSRPVLIQSTGKLITLTFYSVGIDTTWVQYDDEKLKNELFSEYDKYDKDIALSLTKYIEEGSVYYKLVGTVNPETRPIEPSALGEAMTYFFSTIGWGLIDQIDKMEHDELKRLRNTKQSYYKRGAIEALLSLYGFGQKNTTAKEGAWSFSREQGAKSYWVDNYGDQLKLYARIKVEEKKLEAVVAKMSEWVKKNPFKNGISTQVEKSGNQYWMNTICKLGDKTGEDISEDYREKFFDTYCEDFFEEVKDVADDLK
jgi:hypothetical protein